MNIFILDRNMTKSAMYHADKHVSKMLVEGVQLLSYVNRLNNLDEGYRRIIK